MIFKLPTQLSGSKIIKTLKKFGFQVKRQGRGSHVFLVKYNDDGSKIVTSVPVRDRRIGPGLLREILRQTKISKEDFINEL
jgi:predicted RNA binding protein YcfA (HicA-like mRNA interferase family)